MKREISTSANLQTPTPEVPPHSPPTVYCSDPSRCTPEVLLHGVGFCRNNVERPRRASGKFEKNPREKRWQVGEAIRLRRIIMK